MTTTAALSDLMTEFLRERTALLMRHEDVAGFVTDYDINNAYQYIIAREQTHLSWLQHGLLDLGTPIPGDPPRDTVSAAKGADAWKALAAEDALRRIEDGSYGVCRDCGDLIAAPRLNAIPWTRVCITCKEKQKA